MSELILESTNTTDAINFKIMSILNPTLHHHDLLQSYVRAPVDGSSNSKQSEELENFNERSSSFDTCLVRESPEDINEGSLISDKKKKKKKMKKKRSDKKQQKRNSNKLSVESEMKIQKKKK